MTRHDGKAIIVVLSSIFSGVLSTIKFVPFLVRKHCNIPEFAPGQSEVVESSLQLPLELRTFMDLCVLEKPQET
jgi:hypothetical protein